MHLSRQKIRQLVCGFITAMAVLSAIAVPQHQAHAAATYLLAYPAAPYDGASGTYTLTADGTTIPVTAYFGGRYSFGHLAFEGTTTFVLSTRNGAAITSYNISPHDFGVSGSVSGSHLTFSVAQAASTYLIISVSTSAGALEPIVIAGDPKETGAPTIGGSVYDISASPYNADKTGNTLLNGTIQNAINTLSSAGGGTLYFPAGVYKISNNLQLKSNITIYLASGAFLRGSSDRNDYTWNTGGTLQNGQPEQGPQNFLITGAVNNVAFTGRGVIDANSTVLVTPATTGGTIDGFGNYRKGIIESSADSSGNRPNGLKIVGITVKDATTWTFNIQDEQNVTIQNVKMLDDFNWIHSDGYDIVSTDTARIDNCLGITGDDTFDAKAGDTNPVTNIIYSNDVGYSHGGDGTKVGDQSTGTASNIIFSNIQVVAGQRAVSISHDEGTAAWTNIHFNDIHMENLEGSSSSGEFRVAPLVLWTYSSGGAGPVSDISLSRVTVDNSKGHMGLIQGTSSTGNLSDITLQDVSIDGTAITSSNVSSKITVGARTLSQEPHNSLPGFYSRKRSWMSLIVVLLISICTRWEQAALVLLYLLLDRLGIRKSFPRLTLLSMIAVITVCYPYTYQFLGDLDFLLEGATTLVAIDNIQKAFGFPITVVPKIFMLMTGNLHSPQFYNPEYWWTNFFLDAQNMLFLPLACLAFTIVFAYAIWTKRMVLSRPVAFFSALTLIITAVPLFTQPRYIYGVYAMLCIDIARPVGAETDSLTPSSDLQTSDQNLLNHAALRQIDAV